MKKVDAFTHVLPREYWERLDALLAHGAVNARVAGFEFLRDFPELRDMDVRLRQMDEHGEYQQVITLGSPPLEEFGPPWLVRDLARRANEGMAELVARYPDRFVGFAASVPMSDVEASIDEIDGSVANLGALGIQIYTNVCGDPLSHPRLEPIFHRMNELGRPIWIHPMRSYKAWPDYLTEVESRFEMYWSLGWPYETATAVARLIFEGYFTRYPDLRIITHHGGGGIPFFSHRLAMTEVDHAGADLDEALGGEPPLAHFKKLHSDTAMFGAAHAVRCVVDFFELDRVVFGSDTPFGPTFTRDTIANIESLELDDAQRAAIFHGNIERLIAP